MDVLALEKAGSRSKRKATETSVEHLQWNSARKRETSLN